MKRKVTPKRILLFILLIILILIARPTWHILYTWYKDPAATNQARKGYANDAGKLSETRMDTIIRVATGRQAAEEQLVQIIKQAAATGKKISIAGAQHSMGAHTIFPDGIMIDMKSFNAMELDSSRNLLQVGAGALWSQIIPYLDKHGRSVAVMQSNNSFSVGKKRALQVYAGPYSEDRPIATMERTSGGKPRNGAPAWCQGKNSHATS